MNVIRFCGGIGNQLFQYAFGSAQKANGIKVFYNTSWYDNPLNSIPPRPYRLDKFNTDICFSPISRQRCIREASYNPNFLKLDNSNFLGYWQNLGYVESVVPKLKEEIWVKNEFCTTEYFNYRKDIEESDSIGIHVRRGDYVTHKTNVFNVLPLGYYQQALSIVSEKESKIFVFTDDFKWCFKNFKQENHKQEIIFVDADEDYLDFELLKLCKHQIISNSTFSWWAAFLNGNPDKKVVMPIQWRMDSAAQYEYTKGICPEGWIKI